MADWMIAVSQACEPLMNVLERRLRTGPLLQLDETTVQVMEEPDRPNTTKSYVWVAPGGTPRAPAILYYYAASPSAEVAKELIGDYRGHLQTDGYEADDQACKGKAELINVGCWAQDERIGCSQAVRAEHRPALHFSALSRRPRHPSHQYPR